MSRVLGIDAGGLGNPSWLAFLDADSVTLTQHIFTLDSLALPWLEDDVSCLTIDAPQGLPSPGDKRRNCDKMANTPTRRLPSSRAEMEAGRSDDDKEFAYIGPVRAGVALFWANRESLFGLVQQPKLAETYPNLVFRSLIGRRPPPKTKKAYDYCVAVAGIMRREQISCPGVELPSADQCDAILCALAARAFEANRTECLGLPPVVDEGEQLLREGFIVTPETRAQDRRGGI